MIADWNVVFGVRIPVAIAAPLLVSICSFFATLAFRLARGAIERTRAYFDQIVVEWPLQLGWFEKLIDELSIQDARLYCLIIRFGTDEYLRDMASDQERYEGRLLNRVVAVEPKQSVVYIPIHKRLGTQLKFYLLAPSHSDALKLYNALKGRYPSDIAQFPRGGQKPQADRAEEGSTGRGLIFQPDVPAPAGKGDIVVGESKYRIILDPAPPGDDRVWFRVKAFGSVTTVDGYCNNIAGVTLLRDFESRNRWKPLATFRNGIPRRRF